MIGQIALSASRDSDILGTSIAISCSIYRFGGRLCFIALNRMCVHEQDIADSARLLFIRSRL